MKAFYFSIRGLLCGRCLWMCTPDFGMNNVIPSETPHKAYFYCPNPACPQDNLRFAVEPIETTVYPHTNGTE